MAIKGFEEFGELRLLDLVGKTAKASRKDVIRVLIAANIVCRFFDKTLSELMPEGYEIDDSPASPANFAACEQAYAWLAKMQERRGPDAPRSGLDVIQTYK